MPDTAGAVAAAVRRLAVLSHPSGTWTDFWLEPGASSSWVTAYAAVALATAARDDRLPSSTRAVARRTADRAADALLRSARDGTWGWSPTVRADVDSTAWAARALTATARPVGDVTWDFLAAHRTPGGYRTYTAVAAGAWGEAMPEVTATVLLALHEGGRLATDALAARWIECFGSTTAWSSHWWPTDAQPTALVRAAWAAAGRPQADAPDDRALPRPPVAPATGPDSLAASVWAGALAGAEPPVAALLALQLPEGSWPGLTVLMVPPAHPGDVPHRTRDARWVFTTSTAIQALLATDLLATPADAAAPAKPTNVVPKPRDTRWDPVVAAAARSQGCDPALAARAFVELTRESLAAPSPWPAEQLSTLAAGLPLELSASGSPGLRLACEVGDPRLPPHRRLRSGLSALSRTASVLGVGAAWRGSQQLLDVLADPHLPVPDGNRFWLWAGLDLRPDGTPVLKAYLSLLAVDVPGRREREHAALLAAGVPASSDTFAVLDRLQLDGWCQQIGLGTGADNRRGLKVYYELRAWRPGLVRDLLALSGLPGDAASLAPDVPGVLSAALAARQRSGVSLRIDPTTGRVDELTVTAAFPPPLVGRDELDRRVLTWLSRTGTEPGPVRALLEAVGPTWQGAPPLLRRLSLFTRSLRRGPDGRSGRAGTTVYVRPGPGLDHVDGTVGSRTAAILTGR